MSELEISNLKLAYLKGKSKNLSQTTIGELAAGDIRNVFVFCSLHEMQKSQKLIMDFNDKLSNSGKKVKTGILYPTKDAKTVSSDYTQDYVPMILKDFNMFGLPKTEKAKSFFSGNCDLLIIIDPSLSIHALGSSISTNAKYRIAPYQVVFKSFFNVLLKSEDAKDTNEYLCSIRNFLKHI